MRSVRLFGPRDLRLVEEPTPRPKPDEALIRVRSVTVCHSDIHYYRDGRIGDTISDVPLVLGHEFCGEVVSVPAGAEHIKPGDLLAVEPAVSCGHCRYCREGNPNLCMNLLFAGTPPLDGGLREYVAYRPEFLFPLPAEFNADDGAMLEPLGVALHSWDLGRLRVGETVAVVGCGPIGLLLVQLARLAGATQILAVEPLAYRRERAAEFGAIALSPDEPLARRAQELTGGHGVDVAIEVAGTVAAQEEAALMVKRGGAVVMVGIPPEDQLVLTHHIIRRKGLTLKIARRMKHTYPRAIALVQRGMVEVRSLVTHHYSLAESDAAFRLVENYQSDVVKAVVTP